MTTNTEIRFLVLGGTGPCGQLLIRELLSTYPLSKIVVYARSPQKLPPDLSPTWNSALVIVKGDLTDRDALDKAMEGVDVVLSALGPVYGQPDTTPLAKGYELVIDIMRKHGVTRLIALGTASIVDPSDKPSFAYSCMIRVIKVGARSVYRDIVAVGEVIRQKGGDLDWTLLRVPVLTNIDSTATVAGYVGDGTIGLSLPRKAFAAFIVGEIEKRQWVKKAPMITTP